MKKSVRHLYRTNPIGGGVCLMPGAEVRIDDADAATIRNIFRMEYGIDPAEYDTAEMRCRLKQDEVVAVRADAGGHEDVVRLPLEEALQNVFGGKLVKVGSGRSAYYELALTPTRALASLAATKALIKQAASDAGYRSQGRELFPARLSGNTPEFYVERTLSPSWALVAVVVLAGTATNPKLTIEGDLS